MAFQGERRYIPTDLDGDNNESIQVTWHFTPSDVAGDCVAERTYLHGQLLFNGGTISELINEHADLEVSKAYFIATAKIVPLKLLVRHDEYFGLKLL